MTSWEYGILAAAILLCAAAIWCERRKTRRTLEKLNEMLTDAMRGDFTEDSFDETLLSALESKLAHYLAASTVSARNVSTEKEKLKTLIGDISHQTKTPLPTFCSTPSSCGSSRGTWCVWTRWTPRRGSSKVSLKRW